jgi:hypothetical protein
MYGILSIFVVVPACPAGSKIKSLAAAADAILFLPCLQVFQTADGSWHCGCTGTVSLQTIQTRLHSGCALAHIRQKNNTHLWITFNNLDPLFNAGFQLVMFAGLVRW